MNMESIKINKNVGIVTDEAGKFKTVEAYNDNLENTLLKENDLENAKKALEGIQDDFDFLTIDNSKAKVLCLVVLFVGVVYAIPPIILAVGGKMPWIIAAKILFTIGLLVGGVEAFNLNLQKYLSNRDRKKLMEKKEDLGKKVHDLEEELEVLKERSQFKEFSKSEEKADVRTDDMTLRNDYASSVSYSYNPRDVKVLKLVPKKDRNN